MTPSSKNLSTPAPLPHVPSTSPSHAPPSPPPEPSPPSRFSATSPTASQLTAPLYCPRRSGSSTAPTPTSWTCSSPPSTSTRQSPHPAPGSTPRIRTTNSSPPPTLQNSSLSGVQRPRGRCLFWTNRTTRSLL